MLKAAQVAMAILGMLKHTEFTHACMHRPADQYAPWYATVLKAAQVAVAILGMLEEESRASRLSFSDITRRLAELPENAPAFASKKVGCVLYAVCSVQ